MFFTSMDFIFDYLSPEISIDSRFCYLTQPLFPDVCSRNLKSSNTLHSSTEPHPNTLQLIPRIVESSQVNIFSSNSVFLYLFLYLCCCMLAFCFYVNIDSFKGKNFETYGLFLGNIKY